MVWEEFGRASMEKEFQKSQLKLKKVEPLNACYRKGSKWLGWGEPCSGLANSTKAKMVAEDRRKKPKDLWPFQLFERHGK